MRHNVRSLCKIDALAALVVPQRGDAAFDLRCPRSMFGPRLVQWSAGGAAEFLLPQWPVQDLIFAPHILGEPDAVLEGPGLRVPLQRHVREPICVLFLCTDSTSKALQIQQVVAATRESACTGAQKRTRTGQQKQRLRSKVGQFVSIELQGFFWNCPTNSPLPTQSWSRGGSGSHTTDDMRGCPTFSSENRSFADRPPRFRAPDQHVEGACAGWIPIGDRPSVHVPEGFEGREDNPVMAESLAREVGLLGTFLRNLERTPIPVDPRAVAFWRAQGIEVPSEDQTWKTTIRPAGHDAFYQLSECLIVHLPAMERGTNFANFQNELFKQLEAYVGCAPAAIVDEDAQRLVDHFNKWFKGLASPRRVFVPCALTPWAAPRFNIGPVTFVYVDEIAKSEFYLGGTTPDVFVEYNFDTLLQLMRETHAHWLARVAVEGCERQRAEEIGELAVDLAIVALQLAAPKLDTRSMSRLDSRRGSAEKRVISEANGYYSGSWTRKEPGLAIGTGTLADILQKTKPLVTAVGNVVRSFTTGVYRLPNLERAWCDAAYWLHEALAEPIDSIAIAKLETALEVLLRSERSKGSTVRVLVILQCFFGFSPQIRYR